VDKTSDDLKIAKGDDDENLWFLVSRHKRYVEGLSDEEKDTLSGYTFIGDTIINNFMRNDYDKLSLQLYRLSIAIKGSSDEKLPLDWQIYHFFDYITKSGVKTSHKKEELLIGKKLQRLIIHKIFTENDDWFQNPRNIEPLITDLILKTINIILNAPRSRYPVKVYRGIKTEHTDKLNFISSDFWSTSILSKEALKFTQDIGLNNEGLKSDEDYRCCIYEITLKPGVPCLYLSDISSYKVESEMLLPPFIEYRTSSKIVIKWDGVEDGNNDPYTSTYYSNNTNLSSGPQKVGTITVVADRFNKKGLQYLERKRHWRNVKEEANINNYLSKVERKLQYKRMKLNDIKVNNTIKLDRPLKRNSTKRNSFKRKAREEERRKTRKLKHLNRRIPSTNNTN
jgi:hypothetical protein